jgi:hypothetical protein
MARADLIEAVASMAEAETDSRPSLAGFTGPARIPMAGMKQRRPRGATWTPDEDAFLKENLGVLSLEEIGRALGRSPAALNNRWKRDKHLTSPRRNPTWLTLEAFSWGLGVDSHSVIMLADRELLPARWLPVTVKRSDGRRGIRVIDRTAALAWITDPMHWLYFKAVRVGRFLPQGQRYMAKPDVIFWRSARAAVDERRRTWKDAWLSPSEAAREIGLPAVGGINKSINLGILRAVRWGNWWILRSEAQRFSRENVSDGWGPRKIKRIHYHGVRVTCSICGHTWKLLLAHVVRTPNGCQAQCPARGCLTPISNDQAKCKD